AGAICAEDQHALCIGIDEKIDAAVFPETVSQAWRSKEQRKHERIKQQHRTRYAIQTAIQEEGDTDRYRAYDGCPKNVPEIRQAGEAPYALVQTGPCVHQALHQQDDRKFIRLKTDDQLWIQRIAQFLGHPPCERSNQQIVYDDCRARMNCANPFTYG